MQCPYCENDVAPGVTRCPSCGASVPNNARQSFSAPAPQPAYAQQFAGQAGAKSKTAFVILGVLPMLGGLGIHNFYAGYIGKGVAQLLISILLSGATETPIGFVISWIWAIIEACTVTKDARGVPFV